MSQPQWFINGLLEKWSADAEQKQDNG
jgi:hypothetical protein